MQNAVTFLSADGQAVLEGIWHPPTGRATNGALIVLPGKGSNKESELSVRLCQGAAALGLTALRFDFRYVQAGDEFESPREGLSDLLGAYNFLQSFGKEIKPKRLYLIGQSLGGRVALDLAMQLAYAPQITGVGVLGLALHSQDRQQHFVEAEWSGLQARLLVVQGDHDPYADPAEVRTLLAGLAGPTELEIIENASHSYDPVGPTISMTADQNLEKVVKLSLAWLERQEADRPNLRK